MFKGKNVLITGGAGFVGSNLIKRLLDMGANVRATLHKKKVKTADDSVEYITCNLQKPEDCHKICQDMDYIFLCAANTSGAAVMEKTPLAHLTPNIIMNSLMLEAAYAAEVKKVLFISSNTVYPATDYPVKEDDANFEFFEKYFVVGWMKRFSEIMCQMYSTKIGKPMQTVIVRPANVYGPMDDFEWETSHVLPALIRRVVERHAPISVWGDGKDIKDFIYIDDLIDGLLLAMEEMEGFNVVNIASGKEYCLQDILNLIIKVDGYENAKVEYDASKPTMIPKRLIDPAKAKRLLGFEAKTPIEEGLRKTVEWYRNTL
ncbi:MAG: NAD-dependent epimerase/dehydratase family protein [Syntrophales bacterium]|nr:NAD-dependent epimerase/dehydratase family protein [Syntrophales bacterium]